MRFSRLLLFVALVVFVMPALPGGIQTADARGVQKPRKRSNSKPRVRRIKRERVKYKVMRGDSLRKIAKRYGVTTEQVRRWNPNLGKQLIAGRTLTIWTARSPGRQKIKTHMVKRGETLNSIAKKYKTTIKDLKNWNPRVRSKTLKVGSKIRIVVWTPGGTSDSEGKASRGRLSGSIPLESGRGFKVRNISRAYGTHLTVDLIDKCISENKKRFPKAHDLLIGDLSFEKGGYMKPHKSHQSGRDADISYYIKGVKNPYRFNVATPRSLDVVKTWHLFERFLATNKVTYIFVDYNLQEVLYKHAKKRGKSQEYLNKVFQYPRGTGSSVGIIRYSRGHDDHFHIRFKCPGNNEKCR